MHEKRPGWGWILAAAALIPLALGAALFIPLKDCPECEDVRVDFAEMGIDINHIKTRPACRLCGDREKVSLLKHQEYRSAHP